MPEGSEPIGPQPESGRLRAAASSTRHWVGYGWFMTFGTFAPLLIFLAGYAALLTFIFAPLTDRLNRLGIWLTTLGQDPPGKGRKDERGDESDEDAKPPFADRIRPYAPPGIVEKRGRPFPPAVRAIWFVLVGWWLGALWVMLSWSVLLAPYPFLDVVSSLLADTPSVMTLAEPTKRDAPQRTTQGSAVDPPD